MVAYMLVPAILEADGGMNIWANKFQTGPCGHYSHLLPTPKDRKFRVKVSVYHC